MTTTYVLGLPAVAEYGVLVVQVKDTRGVPVTRLDIGLKNGGGSAVTEADGFARIGLFKETKVNDWVYFKILHSPPAKNYVINSPFFYEDRVPPFDNEKENFVRIVVVSFGDRAALRNHAVQAAAAARINKSTTLKMEGRDSTVGDRQANLEAVARGYGVSPTELAKAVRALDKTTASPFESGLSAYYHAEYEKAANAFRDSSRHCNKDRQSNDLNCGYAAYFLGEALYAQGKYLEAVQAYAIALSVFKDDPFLLNSTALSLRYAGDRRGAEQLFRRVLEKQENAVPPDENATVPTLNNLASTLTEGSDFAGAEPLYERALAIKVSAGGWDSPEVATILNNRGLLSKQEKDYSAAERDYDHALAIRLKTLPADHPDVATSLNNLGVLLQQRDDYSGAEPLLREALAIRKKSLPPDHPFLADSLNNLGSLLNARGNSEEALVLHKQALEIRVKMLGPSHPQVAQSLNNLAMLLAGRGDYAAAKVLLQRALTIREKTLGPDDELTRLTRDNLMHVQERLEQGRPDQ